MIIVTGILAPFGVPIKNAAITVTALDTEEALESAYLKTCTDSKGIYHFQLGEGKFLIDYKQKDVTHEVGIVYVTADTPSPLTLIELITTAPAVIIPDPTSPTVEWDTEMEMHLVTAEYNSDVSQAVKGDASSVDYEEASTSAVGTLGRSVDTVNSKHSTATKEIQSFSVEGNTQLVTSETLITADITKKNITILEQTDLEYVEDTQSLSTSRMTKTDVLKHEQVLDSIVTSETGTLQTAHVDIQDSRVLTESGSGFGSVTKTNQLNVVDGDTSVERTYSEAVESRYVDSEGTPVNATRRTEVTTASLTAPLIKSLISESVEQAITKDDSVITSWTKEVTSLARKAISRLSNTGFQSIQEYVVDLFKIGDLFSADTVNNIVRIKGKLIIDNPDDFKGDTIFEVYQYSIDGLTNWHAEFLPDDRYRRHNTSVNGYVDPTKWSHSYLLNAEDGHAGDTIFIQYQYSVDAQSWHDVFVDGDVWRRERIIENGLPITEWSSAARIKGADGTAGDTVFIEYEYSVDGLEPWHTNFSTGDHYRRERLVTNGIADAWSVAAKLVPEKGEDYFDGYNNLTVTLYKRSATYPQEPTTVAVYNFKTKELTGINNGWTVGIPTGSEPVYIISAIASSMTDTDEITPDDWSSPVLMAQSGDTVYPEYQYSADGVNDWHNDLLATDYFRRERTVVVSPTGISVGDWSSGVRIRMDGLSALVSLVFKRSVAKPTKPTGGSFESPIPVGWSDGIPAGTNQVWSSSRTFIDGASSPTDWSDPVAMTDTSSTDYEFSDTGIGNPTSHPNEWSNTPSESTTHMAQRENKNGVWGEWFVMQVKGESGVNGNTIYIEYQYSANNTDWHSDLTSTDYYRRERTVTVSPEGTTVTGWTVGVRIREDGEDGYTPQKGVDYFDGTDGSFTSYVYRLSDNTPSKPTGGSYNGEIETVPSGWSDNPVYSSTQKTWVSTTKYKVVNGVWTSQGWSNPVQWLGTDGYTPQKGVDYFDGKDGSFVSYIYKLSASVPTTPTTGSYDGTNEVVPTGWSDDPVYSSTLKTWVTTTRYRVVNGVWTREAWATPVQWLGIDGDDGYTPQKGVDYFDGVDGSFVSYVYKLGDTAPAKPTGGSFNGTVETIPSGWSDNPVYSPTQKTWVSTTKYKKQDGTWVNTGWSTPVQWLGIDGENGVSTAQLYLYKRSVNTPTNPTTASTYNFTTGELTGFNNGWSRTIPAGTDPIWVISAMAVSLLNTDVIETGDWSAAVILSQNGSDGSDGSHGSGSYIVRLDTPSGAPANDSQIDTHIRTLSQREPQAGDMVTYQLKNPTANDVTFPRQYLRKEGTASSTGFIVWESFVFSVNGNAVIDGSLAAIKLKAKDITGDYISSTTTIIAGSGASTAGMNGYDSGIYTGYRFWAGAEDPSAANFQVMLDGSVKMEDIEARGIIYGDGGELRNMTVTESCIMKGILEGATGSFSGSITSSVLIGSTIYGSTTLINADIDDDPNNILYYDLEEVPPTPEMPDGIPVAALPKIKRVTSAPIRVNAGMNVISMYFDIATAFDNKAPVTVSRSAYPTIPARTFTVTPSAIIGTSSNYTVYEFRVALVKRSDLSTLIYPEQVWAIRMYYDHEELGIYTDVTTSFGLRLRIIHGNRAWKEIYNLASNYGKQLGDEGVLRISINPRVDGDYREYTMTYSYGLDNTEVLV